MQGGFLRGVDGRHAAKTRRNRPDLDADNCPIGERRHRNNGHVESGAGQEGKRNRLARVGKDPDIVAAASVGDRAAVPPPAVAVIGVTPLSRPAGRSPAVAAVAENTAASSALPADSLSAVDMIASALSAEYASSSFVSATITSILQTGPKLELAKTPCPTGAGAPSATNTGCGNEVVRGIEAVLMPRRSTRSAASNSRAAALSIMRPRTNSTTADPASAAACAVVDAGETAAFTTCRAAGSSGQIRAAIRSAVSFFESRARATAVAARTKDLR
jgi:hypothetical protein